MQIASSPAIPTTDELLRILVDATASVTGFEFFHALTRTLGITLHATNVSISTPARADAGQIETLSQFAGGRHVPNFAYAIDTTPCRDVLGGSYVHHPDNVADLFPDDHFLAETSTRSYIGVPLSTPDHRSLGLLTLCHDHPTHHLSHLRHVLTLFAARAAAELTRLRAEQALRDAHATLDQRVRERTAELATVTGRLPCMLWRATLRPPAGWRDNHALLMAKGSADFHMVNTDAAQRLLPLDVPPGEPYGKTWGHSVHPDDRALIADTLAEALIMDLRSLSRDYRCTDRNGQLHWLHEEIVVEPAEAGAPDQYRLFGVVTDVTPRKLAELALRQSEHRYALATEAGRVGVWEYDYVADALYISPQLAALHGYASPPVDNIAAWRNLTHPDDRARVAAVREDPRATSFELEVRRLHRDGNYRWFLSRGTVIRDPATGKPRRMTGTLTDITDRKRAEDALRASEEHFRTVLEQSPIATFIFSPDGQFQSCNPAAAAMYGIDPAATHDFNVFNDPRLQAGSSIGDAYRQARAGAAATIPEMPHTAGRGARKGQTIWIRGSVYPLRDAAGRVQAIVATNEDITAQKQADDAVRASEQSYRHAAESNKRLLLELDHRLRNQLAGLVSLVSLMRDRARSVDDFAAAIDARLRAMTHVHHLLSESEWQDVDLRDLISSLLSHFAPLAPHPTPVHLDGPPVPVPAAKVLPLSLILTEFLTNSLKYGAHSTPAGRVSLTWAVSGDARPSAQQEEPDSASPGGRAATDPRPLHLTLHWTESAGPPVAPNPSPSLGTTLVQSFTTRELAGSCSLTYPPTGAAHTLTFPL